MQEKLENKLPCLSIFSILQLTKCDASQQLKKSWLLEDFVENQPLKISWDAETFDLVRLVNYGKSIHGKFLPEKKVKTACC